MPATLPQKYRPNQAPADPAFLADFLRDELERLAVAMDTRDEVVCGTATFTAQTVVSVVFQRDQPDTAYFAVLGPRGNNNYWISNKLVSGFDVTCAVSTSDNCMWAIFRDRDNF